MRPCDVIECLTSNGAASHLRIAPKGTQLATHVHLSESNRTAKFTGRYCIFSKSQVMELCI